MVRSFFVRGIAVAVSDCASWLHTQHRWSEKGTLRRTELDGGSLDYR